MKFRLFKNKIPVDGAGIGINPLKDIKPTTGAGGFNGIKYDSLSWGDKLKIFSCTSDPLPSQIHLGGVYFFCNPTVAAILSKLLLENEYSNPVYIDTVVKNVEFFYRHFSLVASEHYLVVDPDTFYKILAIYNEVSGAMSPLTLTVKDSLSLTSYIYSIAKNSFIVGDLASLGYQLELSGFNCDDLVKNSWSKGGVSITSKDMSDPMHLSISSNGGRIIEALRNLQNIDSPVSIGINYADAITLEASLVPHYNLGAGRYYFDVGVLKEYFVELDKKQEGPVEKIDINTLLNSLKSLDAIELTLKSPENINLISDTFVLFNSYIDHIVDFHLTRLKINNPQVKTKILAPLQKVEELRIVLDNPLKKSLIIHILVSLYSLNKGVYGNLPAEAIAEYCAIEEKYGIDLKSRIFPELALGLSPETRLQLMLTTEPADVANYTVYEDWANLDLGFEYHISKEYDTKTMVALLAYISLQVDEGNYAKLNQLLETSDKISLSILNAAYLFGILQHPSFVNGLIYLRTYWRQKIFDNCGCAPWEVNNNTPHAQEFLNLRIPILHERSFWEDKLTQAPPIHLGKLNIEGEGSSAAYFRLSDLFPGAKRRAKQTAAYRNAQSTLHRAQATFASQMANGIYSVNSNPGNPTPHLDELRRLFTKQRQNKGEVQAAFTAISKVEADLEKSLRNSPEITATVEEYRDLFQIVIDKLKPLSSAKIRSSLSLEDFNLNESKALALLIRDHASVKLLIRAAETGDMELILVFYLISAGLLKANDNHRRKELMNHLLTANQNPSAATRFKTDLRNNILGFLYAVESKFHLNNGIDLHHYINTLLEDMPSVPKRGDWYEYSSDMMYIRMTLPNGEKELIPTILLLPKYAPQLKEYMARLLSSKVAKAAKELAAAQTKSDSRTFIENIAGRLNKLWGLFENNPQTTLEAIIVWDTTNPKSNNLFQPVKDRSDFLAPAVRTKNILPEKDINTLALAIPNPERWYLAPEGFELIKIVSTEEFDYKISDTRKSVDLLSIPTNAQIVVILRKISTKLLNNEVLIESMPVAAYPKLVPEVIRYNPPDNLGCHPKVTKILSDGKKIGDKLKMLITDGALTQSELTALQPQLISCFDDLFSILKSKHLYREDANGNAGPDFMRLLYGRGYDLELERLGRPHNQNRSEIPKTKIYGMPLWLVAAMTSEKWKYHCAFATQIWNSFLVSVIGIQPEDKTLQHLRNVGGGKLASKVTHSKSYLPWGDKILQFDMTLSNFGNPVQDFLIRRRQTPNSADLIKGNPKLAGTVAGMQVDIQTLTSSSLDDSTTYKTTGAPEEFPARSSADSKLKSKVSGLVESLSTVLEYRPGQSPILHDDKKIIEFLAALPINSASDLLYFLKDMEIADTINSGDDNLPILSSSTTKILQRFLGINDLDNRHAGYILGVTAHVFNFFPVGNSLHNYLNVYERTEVRHDQTFRLERESLTKLRDLLSEALKSLR